MAISKYLGIVVPVFAMLTMDDLNMKSDEFSNSCRALMMERLSHLQINILEEFVRDEERKGLTYRAKVRAGTSNEVHRFECYQIDGEIFIKIKIGSE